MSAHPSIDQLFSAASSVRPSPEVSAHCVSCPACSTTYHRLQHGARILDEARTAPVNVHWGALDAAILAEAESVARDLRGRSVRTLRPWQPWVASGLTLAVAAVALLAVRAHHRDGLTEHPVAHRERSLVPEAAPWSGAVLLSAGGASFRDAAGNRSLAAVTSVHQGATITTGAHGRGVVTVQPGWTLDLRAGTTVDLSQMREGTVTVALADGTVALQRGDGAAPTAEVSLHAGRWTVSDASSVTAAVIPGMVHVVVLGSAVTVTRDGGHVVRYTGPIVLDLPEAGAGADIETGVAARDPDALDATVLSPAGRLWPVPVTDPAATITAVGHGVFPSALETLRLASPLTLRARYPHGSSTLEVGTGHPTEWVRTVPVGGTQPTVVAGVSPGAGDTAPEISAREMSAHEAQATMRFRHCITVCQERGRCVGTLEGSVELNLGADGRVASVRVDPSAHDAETCIQHEAMFLAAYPTGLHAVRIPLR